MSKLYIDTRERLKAHDNLRIAWLINEVIRLNRDEFFRLAAQLEIDMIGNQAKEARSVNALSLGEVIVNRLIMDNDIILPENNRKIAALKTSLAYTYCQACGIPPLDETYRNKDWFTSSFGPKFNIENAIINEPDSALAAAFCFHNLSPEERFLWLDCTGIANNAAFENLLHEKINLVFGLNLTQDYDLDNIMRQTGVSKLVIVLANHSNCVSFKQYQSLISIPGKLKSPDSSVIVIHTDSSASKSLGKLDRIAERAAHALKLLFPSSDISVRFAKVLLGFTACFILAIIIYLFSTNYSSERIYARLSFSYYSNGSSADLYDGETQLLWSDKNNRVITIEKLSKGSAYSLTKIPEGASSVKFVESSFVYMPESFTTDKMNGDSIKIYIYRKTAAEGSMDESINNMGAERWFAFSMPAAGWRYFKCEALDGVFSPQIAIYEDIKSRRRLSRSWNDVGGTLTDTTSAYLEAGHYFLKVRGYDASTGKFRLSGRIIKD